MPAPLLPSCVSPSLSFKSSASQKVSSQSRSVSRPVSTRASMNILYLFGPMYRAISEAVSSLYDNSGSSGSGARCVF